MDNKIKKTCPNCCQLYHIKLQQASKGNLPLFLPCGHSMCESCIINIIKFLEPMECKVCSRNIELNPESVVNLNEHRIRVYELFPINVHMVGELTIELLEKSPISQIAEKEYFIDVQAIMKGGSGTKGTCIECRIQTGKMCEQCNKALCENCFNKSHKTFVIFQNHVLQDIDMVMITNNCKLHKSKTLDYYCHDCNKSICMDCLVVGGDKSCKNHNVVALQEVNETFIEELGNITPKVNEIFKRLTKTALDIGNLLYKIDNETASPTELPQIISNIEQHFSKLCSIIQKHKQDVTGIITKLKSAEQESLLKAQNDVKDALKNAKKVIDTINMTADDKKLKQMNLSLLLEDAKKILEIPWYLNRDESKEDPLKVAVNEDLCALISDYIHLEGNGNSVYKLSSTTDLGPDFELPPAPILPVYPPELSKDVRQQPPKNVPKSRKPKEERQESKPPTFYKIAPQYRSKSMSNNSLNSLSSDSSARSFIQSDGYNKPNVQPVQPFAESQHPKQLKEGAQELIYISHIVDPHDFYVQRTCHQTLVKEMIREFRNAVSLPKPSATHITEGKTYLAYNNVDDMWLRCRIISIERKNDSNPKYNVFFFDFGSTGNVSIDKLRLIPPARLQSPYPLAYNCSLANCEPITGAWTTDDSFLMQKIIDNKQAVILIRHIQATSNSTVKLDCDLTTFEDGVSIAHALVFHERAKFTNPRLKYPLSPGVKDRPRIFMNNSDYKTKMVEEVYFTNIVNPDKFFVRKRHAQTLYEKMCEDLEAEYNLNDRSGSVYLPEIGMVCVVNVEKDIPSGDISCRWARAQLTELSGRGRCRVLLLDSGLELYVHWTKLRQIASKFTTCRALATECHLAGITALNKRWNPGSVAILQKYENVLLELHVEENPNRNRCHSVGVTLYDKSDDENVVCLNQLMIKYKFAVSIGIFNFKEKMLSDTQDLVVTNKPSLNEPKMTEQKPKIEILKRSHKVNEKDLEAKDKGPLRLEAKLLQYQSPSLIYIALVHQQKMFNELFENMQMYYSNKNRQVSPKTDWKAGDRCCTVCFQSQTWRRATIVEIEGTMAKVFYSDFACVETVALQNLVELVPEFASIGDAAIKCHLSGVVPAVGEQWPSLTKEVLKELLDAYNRIFITKIGSFKDKSMPVEIWVYHTEQGGALEPNRCEWRCLNNKIVEQGLGIPDKSLMVENAKDNIEGNDEILSFLNVTGSVQEWLQIEPMPLAKKPSSDKVSSMMSTSEHDLDENELQDVVLISDWLPPEPFQSKEFTGMPTYIDNDGFIYLHDIAQQDTLDLIRKALDVKFKHPDPKAKYVKWNIGEPCVALFFLDQRFYRGRVIEVNEDTSTCLIHYIDYGNDELCSFENIRKSIALHQIPTQAHKCIMDRIRPVDKCWGRHTLDYLHKTLVEKQCYIKITGEAVDGIIPIELKYDKLWINNHLVDFEMAMFIDGSKAPVKKFVPPTKNLKFDEVIPIDTKSVSPDFIVDEEDDSSEDSQSMSPIKGCNWNEMLENESNKSEDSPKDICITYPSEITDEFSCNISQINSVETVELILLHDEATNHLYEEMFKEIGAESLQRPPLSGIFENKACVALFTGDQQWYRALIKQYSEAKNLIKVHYVDYGNEEIISVSDAREIDPEWAKFPPATITAKLHGIKCNSDVDIKVVMEGLGETLLDKGPFTAKVIDKEDNIVSVQLTNANNEIAYKDLMDKGLFLSED